MVMRTFYKYPVIRNAGSLALAGFLYVCMVIIPLCARAQADIHFSQFYEMAILRNPALVGVFQDDYKFGAYYRNQWSTISNPYQTGVISAETHAPVSAVNNDFFSVGLLGYADQAGSIDQKISAVYLALGYNKSLNADHNTYLSAGFTGGYLQYSFDPSKATFNNQYVNGQYNANNPILETLPNPKFTFFDAGAGINFNTSTGEDNKVTYVLGVSGYHFNQANLSYYQVPGLTEEIRWNVNAGVSCSLSENIALMLQANYASQGTYTEAIGGGLISWTAASQGLQDLYVFSFGAFYRYGDAIIPVVKIKHKNWAVGISYDVNISTLQDASNLQGGYEVTLFVSGNYNNRNSPQKKTICPRF